MVLEEDVIHIKDNQSDDDDQRGSSGGQNQPDQNEGGYVDDIPTDSN